jgi:hypothetical protein
VASNHLLLDLRDESPDRELGETPGLVDLFEDGDTLWVVAERALRGGTTPRMVAGGRFPGPRGDR